MDPISLSASIIAVLQLTGTVLSYLNDIRKATKEQQQLNLEAIEISNLLTRLRFRIDESNSSDQWFATVRSLGIKNGPLDRVSEALKLLSSKTKPSHGAKNLVRQLMWKLEKSELKEVLGRIERVKLLVNIALTNDIFSLSQAMEKELSAIGIDINDIKHGVTFLHDAQRRIDEGISDISAGVNALNIEQQEEERRKIEDWLSPIDFRSRQKEIFKGAQAGTRQWLFESKSFQDWVIADRATLWCPGIPGAGKTVTSSIIIDHLQTNFKDENVAVTCLFCNYRDHGAQNAEIFMANLLKQVMQQRQTISSEIRDFYHERGNVRPTFIQLARLFSQEISHFSKILVVIDALDETSEHEDIRRLVLSELQSQPVSLLVTSRYEKAIQQRLGKAERLEIRATDTDVQIYVTARLPSEHLLTGHIQADPTLENTIIESVVEKSQGMFLMARFHMDSLVTKTKRRDVRNALENLPPELDGIYDQTIERIENQGKDYSDLAKRVLLWVSNTFRPLSPLELQFAIAVQPGMTEILDEDLDEQDLMVSVCAGLLCSDVETNTLRFVHYTTQEYFDRKKKSLFGDAHAHIARSCVAYLSFPAFADAASWLSVDDHLWRKEEFCRHPLTRYAVSEWADHTRGLADKNITDAVLKFLKQLNNINRAVRLGLLLRQNPYRLPERFCAVHIAAMYGLTYVTERLLKEGALADSRDSRGWTPLMLAAMRGYLNLVKFLIRRSDVDINAHTGVPYNLTALILAAITSRSSIISVLLQSGADANLRSSRGTALHCAVRSSDIISTELLLEAGADPKIADENEIPVLFHAISTTTSVQFMKLLGKYGANIMAKDSSQRTLLHVAADKSDLEVVQILLDEGLDPNAADDIGQSPLHKALDFHQKWHRPPLFLRPFSNSLSLKTTAIVRALAQKGSSSDIADQAGNRPLHIAVAGRSSVDALDLLLDGGAKIDTVNDKGWTPFLVAVKSFQLAKVRLLLRRGASLQDRDHEGATGVHWARSSLSMLKLLVEENGAEVNVTTNDGCTPLHWALRSQKSNDMDVARYLLDHGVDPEAKDVKGYTTFDDPGTELGEAKLRQLLAMTYQDEPSDSPLQLRAHNLAPSRTSINQSEPSELE